MNTLSHAVNKASGSDAAVAARSYAGLAALDPQRAESYYRRAQDWSQYGYWDAYTNLTKILEAQKRWKAAFDYSTDCAAGLKNPDGTPQIIKAKIIRTGYVPHYNAFQRYGTQYQYQQMAVASGDAGEGSPIVEIDGQIQFGLRLNW